MLRIGFDLDGVLADFAHAFHAVERRLFGAALAIALDSPDDVGRDAPSDERNGDGPKSPGEQLEAARAARRRRDAVWQAIRATQDFWTTLEPIEEGAVSRIHACARRHGWDVFFIMARPATEGDSVERQTERWLEARGFAQPRVVVASGSRGAATAGLGLDYHVDYSIDRYSKDG